MIIWKSVYYLSNIRFSYVFRHGYIYKGLLCFFLPTALWDVKLPCSFSYICKKAGNLSNLFLSLKGKYETSSNSRGLKMLKLDQMLSFSALHISLKSSLHRVFRYSDSFLAPPCLLKRKGYVDVLCLTGYRVLFTQTEFLWRDSLFPPKPQDTNTEA